LQNKNHKKRHKNELEFYFVAKANLHFLTASGVASSARVSCSTWLKSLMQSSFTRIGRKEKQKRKAKKEVMKLVNSRDESHLTYIKL
jgi:hypothetical protein